MASSAPMPRTSERARQNVLWPPPIANEEPALAAPHMPGRLPMHASWRRNVHSHMHALSLNFNSASLSTTLHGAMGLRVGDRRPREGLRFSVMLPTDGRIPLLPS